MLQGASVTAGVHAGKAEMRVVDATPSAGEKFADFFTVYKHHCSNKSDYFKTHQI
jgi:hypothetical protein